VQPSSPKNMVDAIKTAGGNVKLISIRSGLDSWTETYKPENVGVAPEPARRGRQRLDLKNRQELSVLTTK